MYYDLKQDNEVIRDKELLISALCRTIKATFADNEELHKQIRILEDKLAAKLTG